MGKLILLLDESYKLFYLGKDKDAWKKIVEIIDEIQTAIVSDIPQKDKTLMIQFVGSMEGLQTLKSEGNYTLIGDYIYEVFVKLKSSQMN